MSTITSIPNPPGRAWGRLALAAALIPMPFLLALNLLSWIVRSAPADDPSFTAVAWIYGLIAVLGLFFFPLFLVLTTWLAVTAVRKPLPRAKVLGWIAITIVIITIPLLWLGYLVWLG